MTERTNPKTSFTLIYWQALDALELSVPEYILLDTIHGLSLKTGWCYASRAELARSVRMTRRWVFDTLESLSKRGLVEYQPHTRHLRCARQWTRAVAESRQAKSQASSATEAPAAREDTASAGAETRADAGLETTGEKNAPLCNVCTGAAISPVQNLHPASEKNTPEVVQKMQSGGENFAPNRYKYSNSKTIQQLNKDTKGASAPEVCLPEEEMDFLLPEEKTEPRPQEAATVFWETPIVNPPPVAPAPSLAQRSQKRGAADTEPCLAACRELYLQAFPHYSWQYGRDDGFLKGVLSQIRAKIVRQVGEASDAYVVHSFESFLGKVPDWYRRNGHTTPADLNRHFEKHYAAIKAGQGGGASSHLAPTTDRDREYLALMLGAV